jgi:hypothetical protein
MTGVTTVDAAALACAYRLARNQQMPAIRIARPTARHASIQLNHDGNPLSNAAAFPSTVLTR